VVPVLLSGQSNLLNYKLSSRAFPKNTLAVFDFNKKKLYLAKNIVGIEMKEQPVTVLG
jgi:hypothetical protein